MTPQPGPIHSKSEKISLISRGLTHFSIRPASSSGPNVSLTGCGTGCGEETRATAGSRWDRRGSSSRARPGGEFQRRPVRCIGSASRACSEPGAAKWLLVREGRHRLFDRFVWERAARVGVRVGASESGSEVEASYLFDSAIVFNLAGDEGGSRREAGGEWTGLFRLVRVSKDGVRPGASRIRSHRFSPEQRG